MLRRTASFKQGARVGDAGSSQSRRKKQNVMEIDGVLWALDEHGNPLKRLRKKGKDGDGDANQSSGASVSTKRIKKNIIEIDGHPWLCDDAGKPIKKLRKKAKEGDPPPDERRNPPLRSKSARGRNGGYESDGTSSRGSNRSNRRRARDEMSSRGRSQSRARPQQQHHGSDSDERGSLEKMMNSGDSSSTKKKKKVIEIDGHLWACDENGNPVKKVRRKGEPKPTHSGHSDSGSLQRERGRSRGPAAARDTNNARSKSRQPGSSYTDEKGRKHVFDEFGNETVFGRDGKKLRKKGEPKVGGLMDHIMTSSGMAGPPPGQKPPHRTGEEKKDTGRDLEFGIFDNLWDDLEGNNKGSSINDLRKSLNLSPAKPTLRRSSTDVDLGDPDEVDKRNKLLVEELRKAKEEMRELEEQAKKEKAKNLKAQTDMMTLKAEFTEASTELENLRYKVYDLTSEIQKKERDLEAAKASVAANPTPEGAEGIAILEAEKDNLESKLEMERATAQQEIKKKEEQLANMNREMAILRNEVEMLITGKKGNEVDPSLKRLMEEKQEVEKKFSAEKEQNESKIKSLQEMIEALEMVNTELNKQMLINRKGNQNSGLGGGAATASRNNIHNRDRRGSNFDRKAPEPTKSFGEGGGFTLSPGALFGRGGRFGRGNNDGQ
ncbi:unnamed protein product [Cylindrotheca closterium]|uniref:Uncharacterized protein n=1 Tax=Cylindrotheca closterium TaxID=2856 RepID=A0AAD2CPJ1_9STRA|nr:unnamed protein product [Cylindrotheca closterium]